MSVDTLTRLMVELPADRRNWGRLYLIMHGMLALPDMPCLGKADSTRAAEEGNAERDPERPYGDTPLGVYAPARVLFFHPEHHRMGRCAIPLIGVAGQALEAMRDGGLAKPPRRELYIHATPSRDAGRGERNLVPTYGCLRLLDDDMNRLAAKLDGRTIDRIEIEAMLPDPREKETL